MLPIVQCDAKILTSSLMFPRNILEHFSYPDKLIFLEVMPEIGLRLSINKCREAFLIQQKADIAVPCIHACMVGTTHNIRKRTMSD